MGRIAAPGVPRPTGGRRGGAEYRVGVEHDVLPALRVWIDQDLCTGDGICTDHAPDVFVILEDGIAYCREGEKTFNDPGGSAELALVPPALERAVVESAAECPGECIFIEFDEAPELTPGNGA